MFFFCRVRRYQCDQRTMYWWWREILWTFCVVTKTRRFGDVSCTAVVFLLECDPVKRSLWLRLSRNWGEKKNSCEYFIGLFLIYHIDNNCTVLYTDHWYRHKVCFWLYPCDFSHRVAMCGDGCNDCGALKAADCGISLSAAEASVAAPFTSRQQDVSCVPALLCEGRGSLVSTFAALKYNIIAGFTALICVTFLFAVSWFLFPLLWMLRNTILYCNYNPGMVSSAKTLNILLSWFWQVHTEPTDIQYVIMDIALVTVPALVLGGTASSHHLTKARPDPRLLSILPIASILSYLTFQFLTNWIMRSYLRSQPWLVTTAFAGSCLFTSSEVLSYTNSLFSRPESLPESDYNTVFVAHHYAQLW